MKAGYQLQLFFGFWFVAAVAFGWQHVEWVRRRRARGEAVNGPFGQFAFTVIFAPLALMIFAAFVWQLLRLL